MKRIAIIGGGISGLSAAFALEVRCRAGEEIEYVVFESSSRLGGALRSERVDDCLVEAGADSFLTEKPWAAELSRQLGIGDQLIGSNDATRKTYVLVKNKLVALPDGLMFMVPTKILPTIFSPLFSFSTKMRMAREWFHPAGGVNGDESVAALVERHYGAGMVSRLADPLLSGVYGGEAAELSVRAVLPRFAEMESQHGSLGRGMIAARRNIRQAGFSAARPVFTSFRNGMQQLADTLVAGLPESVIRRDTPVQSIQRSPSGWRISADGKAEDFDAVIVATPAPAAASLLHRASPELGGELGAIPYSSSVTVSLGFDERVRRCLPPGFGFLAPRSEGKRMLAVTFVHNKFAGRAPDDRALLRCFLGGTRDPQAADLGDDEIVTIVRTELWQILGITAEPRFTRVYKWKGAMAQYTVGHLERLQRIDQCVGHLAGLALAGNGYRGIGVPDCVRSGTEAAERILAYIGLQPPPVIS